MARVVLYDNRRSAVLERQGDAIRFHPTLLAFAAHHRFEPRPVAPARGNEKGRVERAMRYVRDAFLAGRRLADLATLNTEAAAWCAGAPMQRRCPEDTERSVAEVFAAERPLLLPLPVNPFDSHERCLVRIGKTPYARFDLNDYSVPHTQVRRPLTVLADTERVRLVEGTTVVAEHTRSYDRGAQIEDPAPLAALVEHKGVARQHRTSDALIHAVPAIRELLVRAAARGYNLGSITAALQRLRQQCTVAELDAAVQDALAREVPHPNAVRLALERHREQRAQPAATAVALPTHLQQRDVIVRAHNLAAYDRLQESRDDHSPD